MAVPRMTHLRAFARRLALEGPHLLSDGIMLLCGFAYATFLVITRTEQGIWLVGERFDEARDNAFHFFKFVRGHHPEINVVYVIDNAAPDYERVRTLGTVIQPHSIKHFAYWLMAERIITAHYGWLAPGRQLCRSLAKRGFRTHASVMLQHGVTAIHSPWIMMRSAGSNRLISATSELEREFLVREAGHERESVQVLGFCRFDNLNRSEQPVRQILLMPTWRRWLQESAADRGHGDQARHFIDSNYFHVYNTLLHSVKLFNLLERWDYQLIFYPHYNMQPYLSQFGALGKNIVIANKHSYDVQALLKQSAVLVTDFSSVSFDFAFMGKPVLYLLPDEERFFLEHTRKGYFDFLRDGFGPVTRNPQEAIDVLQQILERGAQLEASYGERVRRFFTFMDDRNCERTFSAVKSLDARINH